MTAQAIKPTEKPIIYVAGPMTGLPEYNYPAFHAAAAELAELGYEVLSPATHAADVANGTADGEDKWAFYMKHALSLLIQAEAVALLPGWETSRGARIEHNLAGELGMTIAPLEEWTAKQAA